MILVVVQIHLSQVLVLNSKLVGEQIEPSYFPVDDSSQLVVFVGLANENIARFKVIVANNYMIHEIIYTCLCELD